MKLFGFDIGIPWPGWMPGWIPGPGDYRSPYLDDIDEPSPMDSARQIALEHGVHVSAILATPLPESAQTYPGETFADLLKRTTFPQTFEGASQRRSEFERLLEMTDFERLLQGRTFGGPRSDRDPRIPTPRTPTTPDTMPPPKGPPRRPGGPIKDFDIPPPVPNRPVTPVPGGSGAGGGGVLGTLGGLLQLPGVRAAGRVLEAVGPVLDVATIWREYLSYPEQLQRQIDEANRRTRRTGPTRRAGPRTRRQSQNVTLPGAPAPRPRVSPRTAAAGAPGELWQPVPGEVPDFTRPPGPVATRRDVSRQPVSTRAPVQMPGWQWLSQPGLQAGVRRAVETLTQPLTGGQSPLSFLAGQTPGGGARPARSPAPRGSAASTTISPDAPSVPRCPSSDPCMRRAADKRREQRKRAKECANKVKVQREVTVCQQSKPKPASPQTA